MYWTTLTLAMLYAAVVYFVLFSVQKRVFRQATPKLAAKVSAKTR